MTEKAREEVVEWVINLEYSEPRCAANEGQEPYDSRWMRDELKLTERGDWPLTVRLDLTIAVRSPCRETIRGNTVWVAESSRHEDKTRSHAETLWLCTNMPLFDYK